MMTICTDEYELQDITWEQARFHCDCGWHGDTPDYKPNRIQTAVDDDMDASKHNRIYKSEYPEHIECCPNCEAEL